MIKGEGDVKSQIIYCVILWSNVEYYKPLRERWPSTDNRTKKNKQKKKNNVFRTKKKTPESDL